MNNGVVLAEPQAAPAAGGWAQDFLALAEISGAIARTAFVPNSLRVFRNNGRDYDSEATAAQVTAAILTGRELGLEPMAALRSIHVIQATPALSALALRAIVLAAGHRIWVEEATNTRATVVGVRAGDTHEQRVTWTLDDAKARGLAGRPTWRTQPRNMLIARGTGDVARLIAADAILGIPYTIEELEDGDIDQPPPEPAPAAPAKPKPLRRQRKPAAALVNHSQPANEPAPAQDEPPLDDDQPDTPPAEPGITQAQMRKMHALFREHGITARDQRLAWTNQRLDRTITSSAELTDAEASRLLDELEAAKAQQPETPDDAGERILDVTPERVQILQWMRRESDVSDNALRAKLLALGLENVPPRPEPADLERLSQKQAGQLHEWLNTLIDQRQEQ